MRIDRSPESALPILSTGIPTLLVEVSAWESPSQRTSLRKVRLEWDSDMQRAGAYSEKILQWLQNSPQVWDTRVVIQRKDEHLLRPYGEEAKD